MFKAGVIFIFLSKCAEKIGSPVQILERILQTLSGEFSDNALKTLLPSLSMLQVINLSELNDLRSFVMKFGLNGHSEKIIIFD